MKIYLMTDLEGVAGVMNSVDWCASSSRYYEKAKTLLTGEVNAAIDGFLAGGATEVIVADGHGPGAIDPLQLDARACLMRGWPTGLPYLLDGTYDAVAWVGQHARSRTPFAHLAHTGSYAKLEYTINGMAVGEFGQFALVAHAMNIRLLLGTGDEAFCAEVAELTPRTMTVSVKRGTTPGTGDECDADAYRRRNTAAIHLAPARARELIRAGAEQAVRRANKEPPGPVHAPRPPYEMIMRFRPHDALPATTAIRHHEDNLTELLNMPVIRKVISPDKVGEDLLCAYREAPVAVRGV